MPTGLDSPNQGIMAILLNYFELGGSFQREQTGFVMEISRYGERNETVNALSGGFLFGC